MVYYPKGTWQTGAGVVVNPGNNQPGTGSTGQKTTVVSGGSSSSSPQPKVVYYMEVDGKKIPVSKQYAEKVQQTQQDLHSQQVRGVLSSIDQAKQLARQDKVQAAADDVRIRAVFGPNVRKNEQGAYEITLSDAGYTTKKRYQSNTVSNKARNVLVTARRTQSDFVDRASANAAKGMVSLLTKNYQEAPTPFAQTLERDLGVTVSRPTPNQEQKLIGVGRGVKEYVSDPVQAGTDVATGFLLSKVVTGAKLGYAGIKGYGPAKKVLSGINKARFYPLTKMGATKTVVYQRASKAARRTNALGYSAGAALYGGLTAIDVATAPTTQAKASVVTQAPLRLLPFSVGSRIANTRPIDASRRFIQGQQDRVKLKQMSQQSQRMLDSTTQRGKPFVSETTETFVPIKPKMIVDQAGTRFKYDTVSFKKRPSGVDIELYNPRTERQLLLVQGRRTQLPRKVGGVIADKSATIRYVDKMRSKMYEPDLYMFGPTQKYVPSSKMLRVDETGRLTVGRVPASQGTLGLYGYSSILKPGDVARTNMYRSADASIQTRLKQFREVRARRRVVGLLAYDEPPRPSRIPRIFSNKRAQSNLAPEFGRVKVLPPRVKVYSPAGKVPTMYPSRFARNKPHMNNPFKPHRNDPFSGRTSRIKPPRLKSALPPRVVPVRDVKSFIEPRSIVYSRQRPAQSVTPGVVQVPSVRVTQTVVDPVPPVIISSYSRSPPPAADFVIPPIIPGIGPPPPNIPRDRYEWLPPPPKIPPIGGGGGGARYGAESFRLPELKYKPSLVAKVFNIKGREPSSLTGLTVRPIPA